MTKVRHFAVKSTKVLPGAEWPTKGPKPLNQGPFFETEYKAFLQKGLRSAGGPKLLKWGLPGRESNLLKSRRVNIRSRVKGNVFITITTAARCVLAGMLASLASLIGVRLYQPDEETDHTVQVAAAGHNPCFLVRGVFMWVCSRRRTSPSTTRPGR